MIIHIEFDENFNHRSLDKRRIQVEFDPNDSVENLKTIITLSFVDLDPKSFDLFQNGKKLDINSKLVKGGINLSEPFIAIQVQKTCCTIF